ncbi:TPA: replication protein [Morganella morganii subsp. morganii]|nr:replication protein [Morganella morganii subsp. morganii]
MNSNVAYADFGAARRQERPTVADLDNGYTRIANEILDATMASGLSETELCIIMAVWRKTYGYNKKTDWISNEQFESMIMKHSTHCSTAKNQLINKKVLIQEGRRVGINKNIDEWKTKNNGFCKTLAKPAKETLATSAKATKRKVLNTKDNNTKDKKDNNPLTPEGENIALEILGYYNELTGSRCQSIAPILKALNTVKSKGESFTADEIKLVMEWAVKIWKNGKSVKPENICRMTRFDGYLSDAMKWKYRDGINPEPCPHEELIKSWNRHVPERAVDLRDWTKQRPAYSHLEEVWNGKTNKDQWREVKHVDTCFRLISQSSLFAGLSDKQWLSIDWVLNPAKWLQVYEQAKREYKERQSGVN